MEAVYHIYVQNKVSYIDFIMPKNMRKKARGKKREKERKRIGKSKRKSEKNALDHDTPFRSIEALLL